MSDILLVNAPFDREVNDVAGVENLGFLYICASLIRSGYSCEILDSYRENWSFKEFIEQLYACLPTLYIGFSVGIGNIASTSKTIQLLRKKDVCTHITIGGKWASHKYQKILRRISGVDSIVVGEGEETVVCLAQAIQKGKDWMEIPGLACRNKKGKVTLRAGRFIDDLDSLPIPDRTPYIDRIKQKNIQSIEFSRGCSGKCRFCNVSDYFSLLGVKGRRTREPSRVVNEMEQIMGQTGLNRFAFLDVDFIGFSREEHERCYTLAKEIIRRGLDIEFGIEAQGKSIDYELFKLLKDAGLTHVNLGIESWAVSQLKRYGKLSTREDNLKALEILEELNIPFLGYLIPIDPYVDKEEIAATLKEVERIGLHTVYDVQFCKKMLLHHDSHFYKKCQEDGLIEEIDPYDLNIDSIPYSQKNKDVKEITRAADVINKIYHPVKYKLVKTAWEKKLPTIWNAFSVDILSALREKCFVWFKDFVDNGEDRSIEAEYISLKLSSVYEEVSRVCSEVTKDKLENFQNFTVHIDGKEASTRLREVYEVRVRG